MASKIKIKVSQFEGRTVYLQAFAYDVCKHLAVKFGAREVWLCKWKGIKNVYEPPDFITVLSRKILKYQLTQRMTWCCLFYVRYFITKFKSFEDIHDALQIVLKLAREEAYGCVFQEVLISLAVISELVTFLYNSSAKTRMEELTFIWTEYFCGIRKNFEEAGGFTEIYKRLSQPKYDSLDLFYNRFIPKYCLPFDNPTVYPHLYDRFYSESKNYYEKITKNLSADEKYEYYVVFAETIFGYSPPVMQANQILRLSLPPKIETFATSIPKWIPDIRKLNEFVESLRAGAQSGQNCPSTSRQVMSLEIGGSPAETEEQKMTSSLLSTEEDFGRLNLRSYLVKTDPRSLISPYSADRMEGNKLLSKTCYVQETVRAHTDTGNKSFKNHLLNSWYGDGFVASLRDRSGIREIGGLKGLSGQGEGRERKSMSLISPEDIKQLISDPSETKQPGNTGLVIGIENLADENKLLEEAILRKSFFMDYLLRFVLHNRAADSNECAEIDAELQEKGFFAADIATSSQNGPGTSRLEKE